MASGIDRREMPPRALSPYAYWGGCDSSASSSLESSLEHPPPNNHISWGSSQLIVIERVANSKREFDNSLKFLTTTTSSSSSNSSPGDDGRHHEAFSHISPFSHFIYYSLLTKDEDTLKALLRNYLTHYRSQFPTGPPFQHTFQLSGANQTEESGQFGKDVFNLCRQSVVSPSTADNTREGGGGHEQLIMNMNWSAVESECAVCYQTRLLVPRECCNWCICNQCLATFLASQVTMAQIMFTMCIQCPNCTVWMQQDEIKVRLFYSLFTKEHDLYLQRVRELSSLEGGNHFLCSKCSAPLLAYNGGSARPFKYRRQPRKRIRVTCGSCGSEHCASCRSPWHRGLSCKEYQKGEVSMKKWTNEGREQRNATYCPSCHTCYQKSDGCDHMYCQKCKTNFCYACGHRYRSLKLVGSHTSRFSVLGCKKTLLGDRPVLRETVRGGILAGAVIVAPLLLPVAAVGGCGVLVAAGGVRLYQTVRQRIQR